LIKDPARIKAIGKLSLYCRRIIIVLSSLYYLLLLSTMADPISLASGLLTLVVFALESSQTLYQVVQSFQSNQRIVRELRQELEALDGVLESLRETVTNSDAGFTALELPLRQCGKACSEFKAIIVKCTAHSGGTRTSFRDWAKLKYMGDDIDGFKNMLAGYKSTIAIALGDANM
jgi:hypothetical protein